MRVAVSQFATTFNVQENLATCIRMIKEAAVCEPSLIVLPEFCNTLFCSAQSWYADHNEAWEQALSVNGDFLQDIAEEAKVHHCYILINVTLRRDASRDFSNPKQGRAIKSNISVTSCLFSPRGDLIHQADKQTLIGYEKDFFSSTNTIHKVVTTSIGDLGLLAGNNSMTFQASRRLALNGAQLLCSSISSFALDQTHLHEPARACENNVFLASANKIGPLIPAKELEKQSQETSKMSSTQDLVYQKHLIGIGQSQIVAPNGKVLAKITNNEEGFVFADIDLAGAAVGLSNKLRPDGTGFIKQQRSELYQGLPALTNQPLAMNNTSQYEDGHIQRCNIPVTANAAIFATYKSNEQAIEDVCHYIENNLSDIIQLPELFFLTDKTILNNAEKIIAVASLSEQMIAQVSSVLRPFQYVCTSLILEGMHQAVIISEHGLYATQQQLHFCQRYQWTELGDEINIITLALEQGDINVAMLTADDANIPEMVNVVALNGIHVLLIPFDIQEPYEVEYGLLSRAAENRICIIAASREKSVVDNSPTDSDKNTGNKKKVKTQKSTGLIANLTRDITLPLQYKSTNFTGYINLPLVKHQQGKITKAVIHPIATCHKFMVIEKYGNSEV